MPFPAREAAVDVLIVGGGLAASLIGLRLKESRPGCRIRILERNVESDDAHTWCLFESDVKAPEWQWIQPLLAHVWHGYDVAFPARSRSLSTRYACMTSASLRTVVRRELAGCVRLGTVATRVTGDRVTCTDGSVHEAALVIDARGPNASKHLQLAWQKFRGLEVELREPHPYSRPLVMDARVAQRDGFRFMYVLPLGPKRLLIEDTRYSSSQSLDHEALEQDIRAYAAEKSLQIESVVRTESGVLPVVLGGNITALWDDLGEAASVGLRGAFFHPTTGYSLPQALATAFWIAAQPRLDTAVIAPALRARSVELWQRTRFYRALNRMLFLAAEPELRYRVLERFYGLSEGLIERFYGGKVRGRDKLRLLVGRPPVPVLRALKALPERAAGEFAHG